MHFEVVVRETDLNIGVRKNVFSEALVRKTSAFVRQTRLGLERYLERDRNFEKALVPCGVLPGAPPIAVEMAIASELAGVGPMAGVAGAFAMAAGNMLSRYSRDVIVENGGDIYLKTSLRRTVGIYAGPSPLSRRLALEIQSFQSPLGICTSSGTVGPSLSFGKADAMVVLSPSPALADAVATAAGNLVQCPEDVEQAVLFAGRIQGVVGAVAIAKDRVAAWGDVKLVGLWT